jgi:colanic acid/amylovoran biosynthesis glycosyltransferase
MSSVIIYRDRLLPLSETFIQSQARQLSAFQAIYAGCRRVPGLDLRDKPVVVLKQGPVGRAEELIFKTTGWSPSLYSQLQQYRPVILHAHFGPDGTTALPLAQKLNIPLLVTFHGFDANLNEQAFLRSRWGRRYLRRRNALKQGASMFIAVSQFIAGKLLRQGFPQDKVQVHYIGVDTDHFRPEPATSRTETVLFVGRLVEKKGCEYLIRAMHPIQRAMPDVELVIIGDGPLRNSLELQAKSSLRRYRFLGSQSAGEVQKWMQTARVLCLPSIVAASGDAEGLPITLLEAQSSGLPVVAFSSAGIPEALKHNETGYLTPEKNSSLLSEHLASILLNQDTWQAFSLAGRERMRKMFDLKLQTAKLEKIYEGLVPRERLRAA